tara:strand:- start:575 stop:721 length:147 start_codon:yes stop_codon:yes gene_type:complete
MNELYMNELEKYCYNLAIDIVGSDLNMVYRVADILYREFEDNKIILTN